MRQHSRRITLGTYTERGLYNSFNEGDYTYDGLREAIKDAEFCAAIRQYRGGLEELGICVAVFAIGSGPSRIVARFPFREEAASLCPACGRPLEGACP